MTANLDYTSLAKTFLAAQLAGDRREAMRVVVEDGVRRGAPVIELQTNVIQAAQHEIGLLWQRNQISIAQEHLATGIAQVVLARLFEYAVPAPRNGKRVMVVCVEGEHHEFPARLVADFLDTAGFTVKYYGADLPLDHLLVQIATDRPDALALSATMSFNIPALRKTVAEVEAAHPELPIVVGGHALTWSPDLVTELGVHSCQPSPDCTIELMKRLTRVDE
ncbi:MAG: cobalamin-dependent protein [Kofleriaceae bacterium]